MTSNNEGRRVRPTVYAQTQCLEEQQKVHESGRHNGNSRGYNNNSTTATNILATNTSNTTRGSTRTYRSICGG